MDAASCLVATLDGERREIVAALEWMPDLIIFVILSGGVATNQCVHVC